MSSNICVLNMDFLLNLSVLNPVSVISPSAWNPTQDYPARVLGVQLEAQPTTHHQKSQLKAG